MSMQREIDLLVTEETAEFGLLYLTDERIASNIASITGLGIDADENLFDSSFLVSVYNGASTL